MTTLDRPPLIFPTMGCGTWAWGNRLLWNYDEGMDAELQRVFDRCLDAGVTLFDTGDSYGTGKLSGRSETLLGQFAHDYFASRPSQDRSRLCLATKLAPFPWRLTRRSMVTAGEASTQRLGAIDLVQLHWSTANYFPWQERALLDGLMDLVEAGQARGVGLSNFGAKRLRQVHRQFADRGIAIASLQVQYSLLSTYPVTELGIKEVCDELGIKLIAYSPLALGLLTGKYADGNYPGGLRGFLCRQILPGAKPLLDCVDAIARSRQKTMAQVALNWCIAKGAIPIPGAKTVAQAEQNIGALGWSIDAGEVAELDRAAARVPKTMVQNNFQTR
jgi:pyridoxine 4-dehydrogenase